MVVTDRTTKVPPEKILQNEFCAEWSATLVLFDSLYKLFWPHQILENLLSFAVPFYDLHLIPN